jgi:nicotinate-nucleotide pyrophosphorylase
MEKGEPYETPVLEAVEIPLLALLQATWGSATTCASCLLPFGKADANVCSTRSTMPLLLGTFKLPEECRIFVCKLKPS